MPCADMQGQESADVLFSGVAARETVSVFFVGSDCGRLPAHSAERQGGSMHDGEGNGTPTETTQFSQQASFDPLPASERPGLPWERRAQGGALAAAIQTLRLLLFSPATGFAQMRQVGGWSDPVLYAVILGTLGTFFMLLWQTLMRSMMASLFSEGIAEIALLNLLGIIWLITAPALVLMGVGVAAAIFHVLLLLLGGTAQPYETSFRIVAYAISASVFNLLPFCGAVMASLWQLALLIIGFREAHQISGGRSVAVVLTPFLFLCACALAGAMLAIALPGMLAMEMN